MKKLILKLTFVLVTLTFSAFSQGQGWNWFFGWNAGVKFPGGGAPVSQAGGQTSVLEGVAAMSDAAGNLLFYTDGITVWNKNHVMMTNGNGLMGNPSSTQSGVIVKQPGNANIYYVFTVEAQAAPNGYRYSIVDMSLSGGLGAVTVKNTLLQTPTCEKCVAVRHCNGVDVWVVTHDWNSSNFRAILLTAGGLGAPVISAGGVNFSGNNANTLGYLKASLDGKRLAHPNYTGSTIEILDFNNSTGMVSNPIVINNATYNGTYGCEFSPDGKLLYISKYSPSTIYQFNLCAGNNAAAINASMLVIGNSVNASGALQLGPDKKIWCSRSVAPNLGVINNPNVLGMGCNYVDNGVGLNGKNCGAGLPNFVQDAFKIPPPPFTFTTACITTSFTSPSGTMIQGGCTASTVSPTYNWNFGNPASAANNTSSVANPVHIFTGPGTYSVTLILQYACGADTIKNNVVIAAPGITVTPSVKTCSALGTASATIQGGTPPITYTWSNSVSTTSVTTGLNQGTQTVTIADVTGCTNTATFTIGFVNTLTTTATGTNVLCYGQSNGQATVNVTGGSGVYLYSWNNGQTSGNAVNLVAGSYTVTVLDGAFCTSTAAVTITQPTALSLTINSSTTNICTGGTINVNSFASGGTVPYTYTWNPGPSTNAYNVSESTAGTYNYILNSNDANGCFISNNINLTFNVLPIIAVTSQTICFNDKGTLIANGAEQYKWTPVNFSGPTYTTTGVNSMYLTIVGTNTSTGCSSLPATATLIVNPLPKPAISQSLNKGCVPLCMTFTCSNNGSAIQSCNWDLGDGSFASNVINTDRCFPIAGNYKVKATVTDINGCVFSTVDSLEAYPIPVADFNYAPLKPIENEDVTFTDASHEATIAKWDWFFMNLPKPYSGLQNPTYIYSEAGTYAVALVATSNHGCIDTIVKTIFVGEDYGIYVPNIFTPNGDGLNDVFQPKGFGITKYELRIFNRWGEELMFTNDFAQGWDGIYKNKLSQEGVYTWKINVTNVFGKSHELSGNVTLIK